MVLPPVLTDRLRLPVIAAPMFLVSTPALVIAECTAGVIGSFPALNARPQTPARRVAARDHRGAWPRGTATTPTSRRHRSPSTRSCTARTRVGRTTSRRAAAGRCRSSSARSAPATTSTTPSTRWGGITLHDVINDRFARKAIQKGADGLIAVAAGAGGHAGQQSPFALVQEIRAWFDGPLVLSGAIATGRSILAAQAIGADLAYIGSPFIATTEANASDGYKQAIVDATAGDILYSDFFSGVHGNYLRPSIVAAGLDPDDLPDRRPASDGLRRRRAGRDEGLARHLGLRTGRRRHHRRRAGRRPHRPPARRVPHRPPHARRPVRMSSRLVLMTTAPRARPGRDRGCRLRSLRAASR